MEIVKTILQPMSNVTKPQRKFMQMRLPLLMCLRGRANFRNLSRYSDCSEKTFSRWYRREFDFVEFNRLSLQPLSEAETTLIAATACRFVPKSGKHTDGLGKFYNGVHRKTEKGLEISTRAVVNVTENTAYNLSTRQTPAIHKDDESRVDYYLSHLQQDRHALPAQVRNTAKRSILTALPRSAGIQLASCATMPICVGFTKASKSRVDVRRQSQIRRFKPL